MTFEDLRHCLNTHGLNEPGSMNKMVYRLIISQDHTNTENIEQTRTRERVAVCERALCNKNF